MAKIQEDIKHLSGRPEMYKPIYVKTTINHILTKIYGEDWINEIILDWVYVQGYMSGYDEFEIKRFLENNKNEPIEIEQKYDDDVWYEISFKVKGKKVTFLTAGQIFEGIKHLAGLSKKEMQDQFNAIEDPYKKRALAIEFDNIELLDDYLKDQKLNHPDYYYSLSYSGTFVQAGIYGQLNCLKYLLNHEDSDKIEAEQFPYVIGRAIYSNYQQVFNYLIKDPRFSFVNTEEFIDTLDNTEKQKYYKLLNAKEELKIKSNDMKKLNEQGGEQIFSEAHAKELLNLQVNYNKMLQALNDKLAKQKSDLSVKYMKIDQQAATQKATTQKTQVPPVQKQTGTVDTTGQPVNAQGNPPSNESINILKIKPMNEEDDEPRYAKNLGYVRDKRNWYQKPENREGYVEPEPIKTPRKKVMTYKTKLMIQDLEYEIMDLESEKQNLIERYINPEQMSGEIEDFFGQIGMEAADILNSGTYSTTLEKIRALIKAGFDEKKAKETVEIYHEYYPEYNSKTEKEKKEAEKQIAKLQDKIDKIQAKIDKWQSMYEGYNQKESPFKKFPGLEQEAETFQPFEILNYKRDPDYGYENVFMLFIKLLKVPKKYQTPENVYGLCIWDNQKKQFIEEPGSLEDYGIKPENLTKKTGFVIPGFEVDESMNESLSTYNILNADKTELQSLKDYMNAEGIEYKESDDTIEFDEEQLDAEWRELISLMGLEPTEISATVNPEDEQIEKIDVENDDIDIVDVEDEIDEDKVFYVKVTEDGEEFIGKIYKLFDEGDWRSVLVLDGDSKTFEKLNYEPDWDVFDIVAFLRENYDDASVIEQSEFDEKVEEPKEEVEEALGGNGNIKDKTMKEAYKIPTLEEFKLDEGILKFSDGETFNTEGPLRTEERNDGWYVIGNGFLIPVKTQEEGEEIIEEMNKKYGK